MDALDLLAREDEFKRLNKQLEKKTESLMKEIEQVMQKQDIFSEFSPSLALPSKQNYKKHCCTPPSLPDSPIKRNVKKKTLKLKSPNSLASEESEIENTVLDKNKKAFDFENLLDSNHTGSDFEIQHLSKHKKNSEFENQPLTKNQKSSNYERHTLNKNRRHTQNTVICDCCPHSPVDKNGELEFLYAFVNVNVKEKVLPPSFCKEDKVSVESVCKFMSSKIKLMQDQVDKLQNAIEKKASQCESHLTQLAELESERMSLLNKTNNMKCSSADIRAKYMATQKRLEEKEKQYKEQRSETDKQNAELKRLRAKSANVEAKCAAQEQLIDSLKQQLEVGKRSEKELRDSTRQLSSTYENAISRLENSLASLRARSEKQSALTQNLRKQNALLAAGNAIDALQVDYAGFLNQDL